MTNIVLILTHIYFTLANHRVQGGCVFIETHLRAAAAIRSTSMSANSGIAVGLNKGRKVTPKPVPKRASHAKGALAPRTKFVRELIKEVTGLAPYERRLVELIRNGQEKRAKKLAKKKLGTHGRALRKFEHMNTVIAEARRHGHH